MSLLYRRIYRITFFRGDEQIAVYDQSVEDDGLRLQFHVRQQFFLINTMGEIHLYNLSVASRSLLKEATRITLEAGYGTNLKILHQGRVVTILDLRQQPDYVFSVYTMDFLGRQRPIHLIIPKEDTAREAITAVASNVTGLIVNKGNLLGLPDGPIGKNIAIDNLDYIKAFERLKRELNVNIWTVNNTLYTSSTSPNTTESDATVTTILNYQTGMIGDPDIDVANAGIMVISLMNGDLIPGNFVKVETLAAQVQVGPGKYVKFKQEDATRGTWRIFKVGLPVAGSL